MSKKPNPQPKNHQISFEVEHLENRRLLATVGGHVVVPGIQGENAHSDHVAVQSDHVVVWGTDQKDVIRLRRVGRAGDTVRVLLNGVNKGEFSVPTDIVVYGRDGNDNITADGSLRLRVIADGGDGDDILRGGREADSLIGGRGDDLIQGRRGNDGLWGDSGTDRVYGQGGNDTLYTSTGGDRLVGGGGVDEIVDETPIYTVSVTNNVTYVVRDGVEIKADVYVPDGDGPFPGVVAIHGGYFASGDKFFMADRAREIARNGYTVVAINYRLAPEYEFPAHIEDAKAAVRWMRTNADTYKIDPDWIASYGYSAGGTLAMLLGTTDAADGLEGDVAPGSPSSRVQAVVSGGGPVDFTHIDEDDDSYEYLLGETRGENPEIYEQISAVHSLTNDDPPMFLFHGSRDSTVRQPTTMLNALRQQGGDYEFYSVRGKRHILAAYDATAMNRTIDFLGEHLG